MGPSRIKTDFPSLQSVYQPNTVVNEVKEEEKRLPIPQHSPWDKFLATCYQKNIVDEAGLLLEGKVPDFLPRLSRENAQALLGFYRSNHTMKTKDGLRVFPLCIPKTVHNVLNKQGIFHYQSVLVGGAVYSFLDNQFIKDVFDGLDTSLYDLLPNSFFEELRRKPNDYDFRLHFSGDHLMEENYEQMKIEVINQTVAPLYGYHTPYNQALWMQIYQTMKQTAFRKLNVEFNDTNRFVIATFSNGDITIDLLLANKMKRLNLFSHDCVAIPFHSSKHNTQIHPVGDYQAFIDKAAKIIHAKNIETINFKGWFILTYLQTSGYRVYSKGLEETLLNTTLEHESDGKWISETMANYLKERHGDDPLAEFCYAFSACRSLCFSGNSNLIPSVFKCAASLTGLPALLRQEAPFQVHVALLTLFGLLKCNSEEIYYTQNEFEPALQFLLGKRVILLPIDLKQALQILLQEENLNVIDSYFNYFFQDDFFSFSGELQNENVDDLIIEGLNHKHPGMRKLSYYMLIRHTKNKYKEHLIREFPKYYCKLTESLIGQIFNWDLKLQEPIKLHFAKHLLSQDDPALLYQALEMVKKENFGIDETIQLIEKLHLKQPLQCIRMVKRLELTDDEKIAFAIEMATWEMDEFNAFMALVDFISPINDKSNEFQNISASFCARFVEKFGYRKEIHPLLEKLSSNNRSLSKVIREALKHSPKEAELICELGNNDQGLLASIIIAYIEEGSIQSAISLLPDLQPGMIDAVQRKRINRLKGNGNEFGLLLFKGDLIPLLDLDLNEKQARLLKERLILAPHLWKTLFKHPKFKTLYTPDEQFQMMVNQFHKDLTERCLELFPSSHNEENLQFAKCVHSNNSEKILNYLLDHGEVEQIDTWDNVQMTKEQLILYISFLTPSKEASEKLLKHFTTLKRIPEMVCAYVNELPSQERREWIERLLYSNKYPLIKWIKELGDAADAKLLHLCGERTWNPDEFEELQAIATRFPEDIPLLQTFDLITKERMHALFSKALDKSSKTFKNQVFELYSNEPDFFLLALKLSVQIKSDWVFQYIEGKKTPPVEAKREIYESALALTRGRIDKIKALLKWVDSSMALDINLIKLLAGSEHPPLLLEATNRLYKRILAENISPDDTLTIIEEIMSHNQPGKILSTYLQNLTHIMEPENYTQKHMVRLFKCFSTSKDIFFQQFVGGTLSVLLDNKVESEKRAIVKYLENCVKSEDPNLLHRAEICLTHSNIENIIPKNRIKELLNELIPKIVVVAKGVNDPQLIGVTLNIYLDHFELLLGNMKALSDLFDLIVNLSPKNYKTFHVPKVITIFFTELAKKEKHFSTKSVEIYRKMQIPFSSSDIKPPQKITQDRLYQTLVLLSQKILKSDPANLDQGHFLYNYLYKTLYLLVEFYPEQADTLVPLLHDFIFLFLPSGHDLSPEVLRMKKNIICFATFNQNLFVKRENTLLEISGYFQEASAVTKESHHALCKTMNRLLTHPSEKATYHMYQTMQKFALTFLKFGSSSLLDSLMLRILKTREHLRSYLDALTNTFDENFAPALLTDIVLNLPPSKNHIDELFEFFEKAQISLLFKEKPHTYTVMLNHLNSIIFKVAQGDNSFQQYPFLLVKVALKGGEKEEMVVLISHVLYALILINPKNVEIENNISLIQKNLPEDISDKVNNMIRRFRSAL